MLSIGSVNSSKTTYNQFYVEWKHVIRGPAVQSKVIKYLQSSKNKNLNKLPIMFSLHQLTITPKCISPSAKPE